MKKSNFRQFGEDVAGYPAPVLNEREIRAAAGILFLVMFLSLVFILFKKDFLLIRYVLVVFLTDFIIRVLINPRYSPTLIIGRLIVSRQVPEYVGAAQKRFAWTIGLVLASVMFFLLIVVNAYSIFTGLTCLICLTFLFFETAFGICIGCLFYNLFHKNKAYNCAGDVCADTKKQAIQKTSWGQVASLLAFVIYIVLAVLLFADNFRQMPRNLWDILKF